MSKRILALALAMLLLFVTGCQPSDNNGNKNDNDSNDNVEEKNENGEFFFKGVVTSTDSKYYIAMEIIDSEVAFGIYHVNIGDQTVFVDKDGNQISRATIKVGDTIKVVFSGQVMLSYPPQISAQKITLL